MSAMSTGDDSQEPLHAAGRFLRYTRVAIWLHWAIAIMIVWNLVSGFVIWDLAKEFFRENRPLYFVGLVSHLSAGFTILALTVVRISWRLIHAPPAFPVAMKPWERISAHFAHFLLYAGMLLMPLTGWAILSAHPPAGSPGSKVAISPLADASKGNASAPPAKGPPPGMRITPPKIWWVVPMPVIAPIANIGFEPGGVKPQKALHGQFVSWHQLGGYLMLALLLAHIAGALKHQYMDKEPTLERMGLIGRRPKVRRP